MKRDLKPIKKTKRIVLDYKFKKLLEFPEDPEVKHAFEINLNFNNLKNLQGVSKISKEASNEKEKGKQISKIKSISFHNLKILHLSCNGINSIEGIKNCSNLKELYLQSNMLSEISEIRFLKKLEVLELENNEISDIFPISGCSELRILNLNYNYIENITKVDEKKKFKGGLKSLKNLRELYLCKNKITDYKQFKVLKSCGQNLRELNLASNNIERFNTFSFFKELRSLDLEGCKIKSIDNFTKLGKLSELNLSMNNISSIFEKGKTKNFSIFPSLDILDLSNNNLTDLDDLVMKLKKSENLAILKVKGNPFCHEKNYHSIIFKELRSIQAVDDLEQKIDKKDFDDIEDHGLDLSLPMEELEKKFLKKLKNEKTEGKETKENAKEKEIKNVVKEVHDVLKEAKILQKENRIKTKKLLSAEETVKKQDEKNFDTVMELYEECKSASENVQKRIFDIIDEFNLPIKEENLGKTLFDDSNFAKFEEYARKKKEGKAVTYRKKELKKLRPTTAKTKVKKKRKTDINDVLKRPSSSVHLKILKKNLRKLEEDKERDSYVEPIFENTKTKLKTNTKNNTQKSKKNLMKIKKLREMRNKEMEQNNLFPNQIKFQKFTSSKKLYENYSIKSKGKRRKRKPHNTGYTKFKLTNQSE